MTRHVVFSHGQESGPWGRKISALAEIARSEGYEAHSVDYRGIDLPRARVAKLVFDADLARVDRPANMEAFIWRHVYKPEYQTLGE